MRSKNEFYVYVIFRPNGIPCYVGKGKGQRADHHARFSHSKYLRNIFNKAGGKLPVVKIREGLTDAEACSTEIAFIAAIGRIDLGTGPLVNLCEGGQGVAGLYQSAEKSQRISAKLKGRKFTEEHLINMSLARMGIKRSPESVAKQKATIAGVPRPWISAALKGRPNPKVREAQLGRKSPEHSMRMKGNKLSVGKNTGASSNVPRKLTADIIREIRLRAAAGEKHQAIASDYGIHKSQISLIHNRRTWAWVD